MACIQTGADHCVTANLEIYLYPVKVTLWRLDVTSELGDKRLQSWNIGLEVLSVGEDSKMEDSQ